MKNIVKLLVLAIAVMSVMFAFASCGCSHEETEAIPAVAATCTEAGATEGTKCKLCGEVLVAPVPTEALGHNFKNVNKVDATCTEDGHEAGVKCDCGAIETGCAVIPAAHKPKDVAAKAPTCTEDGYEAGKRCSVCAEDVEGFAVIPATGHTLVDVDAIAPSCTVAGSEAGKQCSACDYAEGFATVPATGHTAKNYAKVEPTCTTEGYEAGVRCEICLAPIEGCTTIAPLGHTPDESKTVIITAAGLGKPGSATSECSVCKEALELTLPALKGGEWNYTSAEDTVYLSKDGQNGFVNELVTEGDKTYVRVGIVNPGVHPGAANKPEGAQIAAAGETNMVWKPNDTVTLDALTIDNCFVFTTQFRVESYIPKFTPANTQFDNTTDTDRYYSNWMFNPSISTNTNLTSTADANNNHIQVSAVMTDPLTSNEVTALKLGGAEIALKEWMELKLIYRCDQNDDSKYVVEVWVNGVKAGETAPSGHRTSVAGVPIVDFRIKFKNARCFDELVLNFDDTKFEQLPYVCEHEYPADATCAAVPACTKCGKTGEAIAHTPGQITETLAPQIGVAGKGTSVCTVCGAAIEVEIPAIKGATYNYESETDVPRLTDSANLVVPVLKTEGDRTYVEYAFGGAGLDKEWNIFFDAELGQLSTEEYFVFETDIKINSIVLTDAYAADLTKTWFMYTGFTDNTASTDTDTLNRTWYANNADGTKIYLNKNNATDGKEFPYQQWATLKVTVILNADDATKVDIVYYLNGEVWFSHTAAEASKVADGVVAFKLKFKNKKNFVEQSISFDNTKVYAQAVAPVEPEQPVEPEVPVEPTAPTYTFEDGVFPSKSGSSTPDNVVLTIVEENGNKVLKLDNKTEGEAVLFFPFENPVMLTNDNYFKATLKLKVGSIVGNNYANKWIASLGIADVENDRQDNSRLGNNWNMKGDNEVTIGGYQLPANEWVNLEFYFYTTDAGQTVQQIIVINGEYIGDFTNNKLADDTIKGLTFKTKNANAFKEYVFYFDDVSLVNAALAEGVLPQPPACEHEYPADANCAAAPVCTKCGEVGEPIAHTWADATCTAPKTCTVCAATEGEALGHTPGELNVDLAPTVEAAGHATTTCTVCNAAIEVTLPALPEYTWNYTSETDTLKVGNNGSKVAAAELVTEGDNTYVKVTIDNPGIHPGSPAEGDKAAKNTELILSWKPDATMDALTANNQFVFNTKVKFDEIVTKWTPAGTQFDNTGTVDKYYQSWLINFCLSTNTNVDNAHDNFNIYIAANPVMKEGTGVVEQVKVGNGVIDMNEWVELTFVFTLNATDSTKCDIVVYMDGISIYTASQSMKPNVPGNAITDFRIKFKNTRVYDKFVVCFDDSSLDVIAR